MYIMDTKIDKSFDGLKNELSNLVYSYLTITNVNITQNKRLQIKGAVSCFILNTFYKARMGITLCGITLNKNHYSSTPVVNGKAINRKVSYQYTRILFDCLQHYSLITLNKGSVEYGIVGGEWRAVSFESGFIELHKKLLYMYEQVNVKTSIESSRRVNVIIVRDGEKGDVTFRMNDKLRENKVKLDAHNYLTLCNVVENGKRKFDVQMHKVYNSKSYDKGARNYMNGEGIQHLSAEERLNLTINKNETSVFDYKAFEPSIAYSMVQEIMNGDPYTITYEGYEQETLRSLCKVFLLVMFNMEDVKYLYSTLNQAVRTEFNVDTLYREGKIPDKRIDVKTIVQKLEDKHYLIRHMFYGGYHTQPSYVGSLIADYITDYFTQRGILVLSVFDEFIIEQEYEDELYEVMNRAYEHVLGFVDNCKISKEK
ncbi:hypothetical protein NVP1101O_133 [Vibrio phage 1.101.O._10N.261.45.C6]|nr:hypothetical protein NVP1101O_133 [Vibrio phage 1.101.O._10N.261.45.C6]